MRVFQNIFVYPTYKDLLDRRLGTSFDFHQVRDALTSDRYCAVHYLQPEDKADDVFLTANGYARLQRAWARSHGLPHNTALDKIIFAQIEAHRSEVFYTQDPNNYGPSFLRKLPGCVRSKVCWQSPPAKPGDLSGYDLVINNFPTSLKGYGAQGVRTAYFTPSFDPAMGPFAEQQDRPIDIAFAGGYSRHHRRRAALLETVARLADRFNVVFALDRSRLTRLAESSLGRWFPLAKHRRPKDIRRVTSSPVFGLQMYELLSNAKIVLNAAVDSAGSDRGNIRCFEAMGCGSVLVSDAGTYPEGMVDGETMLVYNDADHACEVMKSILADETKHTIVARRAADTLRSRYSKSNHWKRFVEVVSGA